MTRGHHSLASRDARSRRRSLIAAPLLTCAVIGSGVALSASGPGAQEPPVAAATMSASAAERRVPISRDAARTPVPKTSTKKSTKKSSKPKIVARRWTTAALDLRVAPKKSYPVKGEIAALRQIAVTGIHRNGFAQVVVKDHVYWVTNDYLAVKKPVTPAALPISGTPCAGTSGVERGLTSSAIRVYRAVCNNFPQIRSYGGYDPHGEHSSGRAIDIMTSDVTLGNAIAEYLRAHARELNLYAIIWRQRIYTVERGSEGWRSMPSRGSATANHYDHVHVSVN